MSNTGKESQKFKGLMKHRTNEELSERAYSSRSQSFNKQFYPRSPVHLEATINKVLSPFSTHLQHLQRTTQTLSQTGRKTYQNSQMNNRKSHRQSGQSPYFAKGPQKSRKMSLRNKRKLTIRRPLTQQRKKHKRKKFTHYKVQMTQEQYKMLSPTEAQLAQCKNKMNYFNLSIEEAHTILKKLFNHQFILIFQQRKFQIIQEQHYTRKIQQSQTKLDIKTYNLTNQIPKINNDRSNFESNRDYELTQINELTAIIDGYKQEDDLIQREIQFMKDEIQKLQHKNLQMKRELRENARYKEQLRIDLMASTKGHGRKAQKCRQRGLLEKEFNFKLNKAKQNASYLTLIENGIVRILN